MFSFAASREKKVKKEFGECVRRYYIYEWGFGTIEIRDRLDHDSTIADFHMKDKRLNRECAEKIIEMLEIEIEVEKL